MLPTISRVTHDSPAPHGVENSSNALPESRLQSARLAASDEPRAESLLSSRLTFSLVTDEARAENGARAGDIDLCGKDAPMSRVVATAADQRRERQENGGSLRAVWALARKLLLQAGARRRAGGGGPRGGFHGAV